MKGFYQSLELWKTHCRILCHFTLKRISVPLNIDVFSLHLSSDKGKMIAKNPSQEIGLMVSAFQSLV